MPSRPSPETLQQRSAHLLDTIANMTGLGAWELDVDSMTPLWSSHARQIFGMDLSGGISLAGFVDFFAQEGRPILDTAFREAVANGKSFDLTLPALRRDGARLWVRCVGDAEVVDDRAVRLSGAVQDVTQQYEAQLRLQRASRSSFQGHWEYDFGTDQVWCSEAYQQLLGFAPRERRVAAASFHAETHPDDEAAVSAAFARHIADETPYDVQLRLRTAAGHWRWFRRRGAMERDKLGRITSLAGQLIDIHDERQAQVELREIRARFERAIEGSSDGLYEYDLISGATWYSPSVREMLGYGADEPFPASILELTPPAERFSVEEAARQHVEQGAPFDVMFPVRHRNGENRWVRSRGRCERNEHGTPTHFSGSIQDITAQLKASAALVAATEEASAANRAKSDFLANMSHEIRTPMNGVLGMTELLLDTSLNPVQHEYAETIRTSATSLLGILNDILDFSKIEAGRLEVEAVEMDVRDCVEDVGTMMAVQAAAKNLEFIVNVDPATPECVLADPHRLRQILTNLAGNAIKFTQAGEVVIEVHNLGTRSDRVLLHFEVRDTGVGMAPEVVEKLFQPFVQADASTTRHFGGTGLGLSIVKRLCELMGGSVNVVSRAGVGTSFSVTLPCEPLVTTTIERLLESPQATVSRRILVVDDNDTNRRVLRGQLLAAGHTVETTGRAGDVVALLSKSVAEGQPFDLVIADDQMPDADGSWLAQKLKSDPALEPVPLVLLTSLDRHGGTRRLADLGFAGYLTKPVRGRELRACVERVIDSTQQSGSHAQLVTRSSLAAEKVYGHYRGRVLVAEDNIVNQQVTRRFLERLGCRVELADNGLRAVEFCAQSNIDLVLMDVQMPIMDGLTATREIRRAEVPGRRVPILALTASAMTDELDRCLAAGMDGLLTKPLQPLQLRESLERHGLVSAREAAALEGARSSVERVVAPGLDLARLRTLVGDDPQFMEELCRTFMASSTRLIEELRQAVGAEERTQVKAVAHKLKGGAGSVCAQRIMDLSLALEHTALVAPAAELAGLVEQIRAALGECASIIEVSFS
ncbi:MAG TPA: response regulator [Steroidobacteraceae bacterium]|jgi:two-component system sensor histidine kinase/response regulator|nr:response regulator [Steroidobacteraceae bacterium]